MKIGETVSHYTILERLGQGGMGTVFKARDERLGRIVAIKALPPGVGADADQRERFLVEARAASAIDHPNIGSVFEIDETPDGELFIAMAHYEGKNLRDVIREGPLEAAECCRIGSQVARGMSEAHARGIIHRDIKPANIIVTPGGLVKIIDFGLAKLSDGLQLTRAGTSLGTLAYMSPEQIRSEEIGPETDIWALGIILFEMLTGRHPFHGQFEAALMYSIANEPPLQLSQIREDVPPALEALIGRMLAKARGDRPGGMAGVADALDAIGRGETPVTRDSGSALSGPGPGGPGTHGRLLRGAAGRAAAAVLVLAAFAGGYFLFRSPGSPSLPAAAPSIAVVPFAVTGEDDLKYLGVGMASEIAGALSRVPDLLVIAHNSAAAFSDTRVGDSTIAERLGVRYVLRGSIRVTVAQIFYDIFLYDHSSGDAVLVAKSAIARKDAMGFARVIGAEAGRHIGLDLSPAPAGQVARSAGAFESYLQGTFHRDKLTKEDLGLSLAYYHAAIEADQEFLPAKLGCASTLIEAHLQGTMAEKPAIDEAEALCRIVLAKDSVNDAALAILGKVFDLKGDRDGGLAALNRALELNPENDYALTVLAQMYITELNDPVRGIVLLKRLNQVDPLNWLTNLNLGVAYAQDRNYDQALSSFRRSAELNPAHAWPVYSVGYLFEILGRFDSAAAWYSLAISLDPTDTRAYVSLVTVDLATGRLGRADSTAADALRRNPGDHVFLYLRGLGARLGKRNDEAGRYFGEGYALVTAKLGAEPATVEYVVYRGLFAARMGRADEAAASAEEAARLDSTHEQTAMDIARIYASAGMKNRAIRWFRKARSMNPEYNEAFLATALDFERYRLDPELLLAVRR